MGGAVPHIFTASGTLLSIFGIYPSSAKFTSVPLDSVYTAQQLIFLGFFIAHLQVTQAPFNVIVEVLERVLALNSLEKMLLPYLVAGGCAGKHCQALILNSVP